MPHTIKQFVTLKVLGQLVLLLTFLFGFWVQASASDFTATLDVEDAAVVGNIAILEWYVTGGPATCTINHGVGTFEVTTNPQSGIIEATPPASGEPFLLSCSRGGTGVGDGEIVTDDVVVIPNPIISFTPSSGGTDLVNGLSGSSEADLVWNAQYATQCSVVSYVSISSPSVVNTVQYQQYSPPTDPYQTSYDTSGRVQVNISETTVFYITCTNEIHGTETTETLTMTVVDPPPPEPVVIDMVLPVAEPASVTRDPVRNYGTVRFEFRAVNATYCTDYKAYNIHEYPTVETSLPAGYDAVPSATTRKIDLRLGTSTVLQVSCGRPEVNIGGTVYPATSTTLVKTFLLTPESSASTSIGVGSSYASANVTATPSTIERDPLTGVAYVNSTLTAANVDHCKLDAYRVSDGQRYSLAGWTVSWLKVWSDSNQTINNTYNVAVATSTVLQATCVNIYDFYYGTPEEQANATVYASTTVVVTEPSVPAAAPEVWLYSGPSLHLTADDLWDDAITKTNIKLQPRMGRNHLRVNTPSWSGGVLVNNVASLSFTFDHPHGEDRSDIYNIHMRYCDESDGASIFTFSTDGSGEIGQYVSGLDYPGQSTSCDSSSEQVAVVAEGVVLADGETITITCTADANVVNGSIDMCHFSDLYIGTGSGGRVVSVPEDVAAPENRLIWMTEGATACQQMEAETSDGTNYVWSYSNKTYGSLLDYPLSPITTYSVTCDRAVDNVDTTQEVEVITSENPDIPLLGEETVSDEAIYEVGACWDVAPEPDVLVSSAPTDHVVAPDGLHLIPSTFVLRSNQCVPLVDLSVSPVYRGTNLSTDSVIDITDGVDNVNGTYNLSIVPYVQNLANIDLPQDASIPYRVTLSGGSVSETNSGFFNQPLPANTPANVYQLTDDRYDGIQFGTYNVEVRFNMDGTPNYPDSNFSNNRFTDAVVLAVPQPHITVLMADGRPIIDTAVPSVEAPLVRSGFSTDIGWSVNVNYPLNCSLTGPGIGTQNLTLGTVGSNNFGTNPATGVETISLQSSGEFQLECTEPTTGQVFTETGFIEVVPDFQEL